MGMKPRHASRSRNVYPMIAEDGAYRGACCAEMLTTKCEHLDDVTVYSNWDEGVTEMRCNECNCTWETVIE